MPIPNCPQCEAPMKKRIRKSDNSFFWGCPNYFDKGCKGFRLYRDEDRAERKKIIPSKYQEAIFDWIKESKGHAFVEAVAGSGKTSTIEMSLDYLSKKDQRQTIFCAFNRHIANELQSRVPAGVRASTIHSLGFNAINKSFDEKPMVDSKKLINIINEVLEPIQFDKLQTRKVVFDILQRLIPLVKATLKNPSKRKTMEKLCERYSIETNGGFNIAFPLIEEVLTKCREYKSVIDFDDMIWLPVIEKIPVEKFKWIFVDEAQDLNACQMEFIMKMRKRGTRIVCVGDRHQSIYGFRGADFQAVPKLIKKLKAKCLPLSICYRCGKTIVEYAKRIVPHIEAWDEQEDGVVESLPSMQTTQEMEYGNMVMCRINAPLIPLAYRLIKMDKKVVIRGRDIGKGLINLIEKLGGTTVEELIVRIQEYRAKEMRKLALAKKENQLQTLEDKCDTLIALTEGMNSIAEIKSRIESIFSDDVTGIILSSIHRAKGLEADTTFILEPGLLPFPKAKGENQMQQEKNLEYVCYTRAKKRMVFIR